MRPWGKMRSSREQLNYGSEPVRSRCAAARAQSVGMLFDMIAGNAMRCLMQ